MKTLFSIFITFFKIGIFTFGGGYAMIMMMQREVAHHRKWVTEEQFLSYLALAQASPGPMAVNVSILIGYHQKGWLGGMVGFVGSVLPSFFVMLLIALFFRELYSFPIVAKIFMGLRPAVVALIILPVLNFAKHVTKWEYPLFVAVAAAIYFGVSPILIILLAIVHGVVVTYRLTRVKK